MLGMLVLAICAITLNIVRNTFRTLPRLEEQTTPQRTMMIATGQ